MEKVLFVGGRRGLGAQVAKLWQTRFPAHELAVSSRQSFEFSGAQTLQCDFAKPEDVEKLLGFVKSFKPQRIFCFAGGGPYGSFESKAWKDHSWALQVSLFAPMQLVHAAVTVPEVQQVVVVGSAIAESQADKNAASYSAAKHGLKGFIATLNAESSSKDIRLFSPGYMATDMLPLTARDHRNVAAPEDAAVEFVRWVLDQEASWHLLYQPD